MNLGNRHSQIPPKMEALHATQEYRIAAEMYPIVVKLGEDFENAYETSIPQGVWLTHEETEVPMKQLEFKWNEFHDKQRILSHRIQMFDTREFQALVQPDDHGQSGHELNEIDRICPGRAQYALMGRRRRW